MKLKSLSMEDGVANSALLRYSAGFRIPEHCAQVLCFLTQPSEHVCVPQRGHVYLTGFTWLSRSVYVDEDGRSRLTRYYINQLIIAHLTYRAQQNMLAVRTASSVRSQVFLSKYGYIISLSISESEGRAR